MDRKLLARATEGTDAPTPGYMYVDIAKNASSSPAACQEIAQYLTRKLASKQNHNIKYKCCKVIAKAAEQVSRGQFKRCIIQDPAGVAAIKEAMNFRGPPDPVLGDEIYNRVRQAAREALDSIYADNPTSSDQPSSFNSGIGSSYGAPTHQAPGYGGAGGGIGAPGGGGRRMEGIGNPMFSDPRLEPEPSGVKDMLRDVGDTFVGMIKDPLARNSNITGPAGGMPRPGGMQGYGNQASYGRPPPGQAELSHATNGQWTMASNRGPNAVGSHQPTSSAQDSTYYKSRDNSSAAFSWAQKNEGAASGGVGGSWATSSSVASQARQPTYSQQGHTTPSIAVTPGSGAGGTAVSDGSYEKNLIMELCPPGGMKPVPPADKLASFARSVPSLSADMICPVLLDLLEEGHPWVMRAKALGVMETCIQSGHKADSGINPYADFFYECRAEIEPLGNHARAGIRDPARRILTLLGLDLPTDTAPPSSAPQPPAPVPAAAPPAPVANLLDFDAPAPAPAVAEVAAPPAAAPPPPPAGGGSSMFGGMQVKGGTSAPPPTPAPAAPPAAPTSGNLLGDLSGLMEQPATGSGDQAAASTASMFDNLTISTDTQSKKEESAASNLESLAPTGSAFGFINDASTTSEETQPAPAAVPTKQSFDPLMNMTPNTAKKMMQVSPEQMQAMAYQQMMMQQQMQQMQMAMAVQAQQKAGGQFPPRAPVPGGHMMGVPNAFIMGGHAPGATSSSFSFLDNPKVDKVDKSFDFIKDAMKSEKKK